MNYHLDYETFGTADLPTVGAYRYACDPDTEILMFSISSDEEGPYIWVNRKYRSIVPSDPRADRLVRQACTEPDALIWAHSATFEVAITKYRWDKDVRLEWKPRLRQWRCTAALCRAAAMPDKLELAAKALKLDELKDDAGKKLIKLLSEPQKNGKRIMPEDRPKAFAAFTRYCLQDNRAEKAVHTKLAPFEFKGPMLDAWLFDLQMNDRGFPVNVKALKHAYKIIQVAEVALTKQFQKLTGLNPTQREKVKALLHKLGCDMPDMQADTVENMVEDMPSNHKAYRVLKLYSLVQFAAVKKVKAMLDCVCPDGWVRGMLVFYGAGTGRWAGRGVQPQNFKRPTITGAERVYQMLCNGASQEDIELIFGNVLDAISSCIRNFIHWMEGPMFDADYNAIEARGVCWLAGQHDILNEYRKGVDQYIKMAAMIYGRPEGTIGKKSDERELGKRAVLGCGFSMAGEKFQYTCKKQYGIIISRELADRGVIMYRKRHNKVRKFWYNTQGAAIRAISRPGEVVRVNDCEHIRFWTATVNGIPYLFMRLPSGRKIVYPWPELTYKTNDERPNITFYGKIKGNIWGRVSTYGGKLVENATQGTAADVMMHGSVRAAEIGYRIIMLVHDQAPALVDDKDSQSLEEYSKELAALPSWAEGFPIKAEGRIIPFYKK